PRRRSADASTGDWWARSQSRGQRGRFVRLRAPAQRDTHPRSRVPSDADHRQTASRWSMRNVVTRLLVVIIYTFSLMSLIASDPCSPCEKSYESYESPELVQQSVPPTVAPLPPEPK